MIAGAYTLDLYCRYGGHGSTTFQGKTLRECVQQAREAKWKFSDDDVTCPHCIKNGLK